MAEGPAGTVAGLRRYPVKSMLGEDLTDCGVTERGLDGDRRLALIDRETGKVVSAKNPRLWRRMLTLSAVIDGSSVKITFPDGAVLDGAPLRRRGPRAVRHSEDWRRRSRGIFLGFAPLHLVTPSTLDAIAASSPRGTVETERYRPNLIIRTPGGPGFIENDWAGRDLRIGNALVIRVVARSPRCVFPTLEHGDLPHDTDALACSPPAIASAPWTDSAPSRALASTSMWSPPARCAPGIKYDSSN